jgi:hypothetical protein
MKFTYYGANGEPLTRDEFITHCEMKQRGDPNLTTHTYLPNGYVVSTVWLGLDHSWGQGPPLIFETMVFGYGHDRGHKLLWDYSDKFCARYSTLAEAKEGHKIVVSEWNTHAPYRFKPSKLRKKYAKKEMGKLMKRRADATRNLQRSMVRSTNPGTGSDTTSVTPDP